jgi:FAD/FMN-containing dehydrogenase
VEKITSGLRDRLACPVLSPSDPLYESARRVWNGMIDRRPSAIVRVRNAEDVSAVIRFARDMNHPVSVRGGGHSVAGKAVADNAIMIDLSHMKALTVDPVRKIAAAQGGLTWGEFDRANEAHGLAVTGGVISSTGIAGLTVGGGIGWLMGKHGLACDNLISAEMVDAEGRIRKVDGETETDLFWALRGGGGNFGVVTSFTYRLHAHQSVYGGLLLYPRASAAELLRRYRDVTRSASDELTAYAALMTGHGTAMAAVALCHCGSLDQAVSETNPLRLAGPPLMDLLSEKKYSEIQTMLDISAPAGLHYYFKCPFLENLSDEVFDILIEYAATAPSEQTQIVIEHMHGAASRVPVEATAFGQRKSHYSINIMPAWENASQTEHCVDWARRLGDALVPFGASAPYVNYLSDDEPASIRSAYGFNYQRLRQLKAKYDPENFFRFNPNIAPST